jgi:hypothetical protein
MALADPQKPLSHKDVQELIESLEALGHRAPPRPAAAPGAAPAPAAPR